MKRLITVIALVLIAGTACAASPEAPLKLGVLAYRPKPQTIAQWQPLAAYLQSALKRPVELKAYEHGELAAAAARRAVDVVVTTPNHYVLLQHTSGLSSPLATLISSEGARELSEYAGVIFARSDRRDLASLPDLAGKRIAAASTDGFGGYQMQAFELLEGGEPLPAGDRLLLTGQPQDRVVEAVLSGRADAGFARSGLLESLARDGKLDLGRIKVVNRRVLPAFPFAASTRLYPEWPVAVMPQIDRELAGRLAAALFLLPRGSFHGPAAVIHGFGIPANYDGVENLMRRLALPPFDRAPEITPTDLWRRYASRIVALAGLLLLLAGTSAGLVVVYRRSRQSLRELERLAEKERLLLASLAEGVYGVDLKGNCIFVNPRALAMLGFEEGEIIGRDAHRLFHGGRGDDAPSPHENCPVILTLRDGLKRELEDAFISKDGTMFPVSLAVSAMRHGGDIVGAVAVFQDTTARKQAEKALQDSEARFRRLAENARDVIYRMSLPNGVYEYVSPAAVDLFGYAPEEFYAAPGLIRKLVHPDWEPDFEKQWTRLLNGEAPPSYEFQIVHKNGEARWVNQRNIQVRDEGGRIVAIEGIVTDVTERKKAEDEQRNLNAVLELRVAERTSLLQAKTEELERANERLTEMDRVKSMFLASMSHELRTPLNAVIGFSSVLLNEWVGPVNEEQKQNLASINASGRLLLDMITDVLDVTQIEAGAVVPVVEEFDLHDLLAEAESATAALVREKGLVLHSEPLTLRMRTDRRRLLQCVQNMLSNAAKFTDTGSVTLSARLVPAATPEPELVEITVVDTGIGIDPQDQSRLFQPFSRIVTPERVTVPGTGLGLFLTRKVATEILKGDILVSSERGRGSRFSLRIPAWLP